MSKKADKNNGCSDKFVLIISIISLIISTFVAILQFSPFLDCVGLQFQSDGKKLFLSFRNHGNIPTNQIKGGFCIVTNQEPNGDGIPANIKVILYRPFNFTDDFYPTANEKEFIPTVIPFIEPFKIDKLSDVIHLLIYFDYPQFGSMKIPFIRKEYRGVFYRAPDGTWYHQAKTLYPEMFEKIFKDLKNNQSPTF